MRKLNERKAGFTALWIQLLRPVFKKENAAPEETNMPPLDLRPVRMRQAK